MSVSTPSLRVKLSYVAAKERVHMGSLSLAVLHRMRGISVHRRAGQSARCLVGRFLVLG
jgi:hypothetical protein